MTKIQVNTAQSTTAETTTTEKRPTVHRWLQIHNTLRDIRALAGNLEKMLLKRAEAWESLGCGAVEELIANLDTARSRLIDAECNFDEAVPMAWKPQEDTCPF